MLLSNEDQCRQFPPPRAKVSGQILWIFNLLPTTLSEKAAQALSSHPILSLLELLLATMGLILAKVLDAQATALFWGLPMPLELQGTWPLSVAEDLHVCLNNLSCYCSMNRGGGWEPYFLGFVLLGEQSRPEFSKQSFKSLKRKIWRVT